MRKEIRMIILYGLLLFVANIVVLGSESKAKSIPITKKNFPDKCIRKELKLFDKNKNGALESKELKKIKVISVDKKKGNLNIKGLSKCKYIQELYLYADKKMLNSEEVFKLKRLKVYVVENANKTLNLSKNKSIEKLEIYLFNIKKVSVENCSNLEKLRIYDCKKIKKIEVKNNAKLRRVNIEANPKVQQVEIKNNKNIRRITISENYNIKQLKILGVPEVYCICLDDFSDKFQKLELEEMESLKYFSMSDTPLSSIDLGRMPNVKSLYFSNNEFESLDFSPVTHLKILRGYGLKIEELDISNTKVESLRWTGGKLKSLKVNNDVIERLDLQNNQLSGIWDLNQYPKLDYFDCNNNKIEKIIATNHQHINTVSCENNNLKEFNGQNAWEFYIFYGKGNPNAKLYFYYPKEDSHTNYSFDRTATVYYDTNG